MLRALQVLREKYTFNVEIIDVDSDDSLVEKYDELVPVLFGQKGNAEPVQLCHYFLNETQVEAFMVCKPLR